MDTQSSNLNSFLIFHKASWLLSLCLHLTAVQMNVDENVTIANLAPPLNMTVPRKVKQNNRNNLRAKDNMLKNIITGSEMTVEIFCRTVLLQFFGVHPPKLPSENLAPTISSFLLELASK